MIRAVAAGLAPLVAAAIAALVPAVAHADPPERRPLPNEAKAIAVAERYVRHSDFVEEDRGFVSTSCRLTGARSGSCTVLLAPHADDPCTRPVYVEIPHGRVDQTYVPLFGCR